MKSIANIKTRLLFGILFVLFILGVIYNGISTAKFSDLDASQIRDDLVIVGALDKDNSIGQTFVAQKSNLSSIKFLLDSNANETGLGTSYRLTVHLQDIHHTEIAFESFSVPSSAEKLNIEFSFPPQFDSLHKVYYLLIETDAPANTLSIWCSLFDSYPNGSIYLNEDRSEFDLTFWTYYKPTLPFWITDTIAHAGPRFTHLFVISFAFFFLGLLVYLLLGRLSQNLIEEAIYAIGIGISAPPLLFFVMSLFRIHLNKVNVLIVLGILMVLVGVKYLISFRTRTDSQYFPKFDSAEATVLGLMFLLAAFTRASQINYLTVPNWVDGLVHQEFLTRILERQYMSFDAIYPKGFHANVAFEYLLFGSSLSESILMMGQWLSLISGLTFYMLARKLLRVPYSLLAVGVYWFWTAFPAFLINWGRYPYLQGLAILPVAITIFQDNSFKTLSWIMLTMLLVFGLGLTYYGSFMIFVAFLIVNMFNTFFWYGFAEIIQRTRWIALSMLPVILVLLIRLPRALGNGFWGQDSTVASIEDSASTFEISLSYGSWLIWVFGILGLVLVFVLEYQKLFFLLEWFLILLIFDILQSALGITISSLANTIIFLSIPVALLTGFVFKVLWIKITRLNKSLSYTYIVLLAISGAYHIGGMLNPSTILYGPADQRAMEWIDQSTPNDSVFLINSFLWGDVYAPSDGGGWISFTASRKTILFDINKFEDIVADERINYIYVGRGYGDINPNVILNDHRFLLVYNEDGIRIFKLNLH